MTPTPSQELTPSLAVPATQEAMTISETEHELFCDVQRSIRYHRARQAFFSRWANRFNYITLLAGSGVVVSLLSEAPQTFTLAAGAIIAATQTMQVIGRPSDRATEHNSLANEFISVERAATIAGTLSNEEARRLRGEVLTIEAREPPVKRFLDTRCHNEVARALGSKDLHPLTWFQRTFAHYLSGPSAG